MRRRSQQAAVRAELDLGRRAGTVWCASAAAFMVALACSCVVAKKVRVTHTPASLLHARALCMAWA
jgi:hypothetical protein